MVYRDGFQVKSHCLREREREREKEREKERERERALFRDQDFKHPKDHFQVPEEAVRHWDCTKRLQASGIFSEQVLSKSLQEPSGFNVSQCLGTKGTIALTHCIIRWLF